MSDHKHGEMDIETQKATFDGFIKFTTRGTIIIIAFLILLALIGA
ncbi:aa3-type cytochrome c oxidase subunit IV [Yoonia sp. 208BN28-4]